MWIKNKDTITNCEHIVRIEIGDSMIEDGELCIFAIDDLGRCKCIGKFNTKKKTQEIFSNILDLYSSPNFLNTADINSGNFVKCL